MRILNGGAPGMSLADMWSQIRDYPQPGVPAKPECIQNILDAGRAPPSKALIKRVRRERPELVRARPDVERVLPDRHIFHKAQMRQILGVKRYEENHDGLELAQKSWQTHRDVRGFGNGGA